MITVDMLQSYEKDDLAGVVPALEAADIQQLVAWLDEKDDNIRYKSFLLLQSRSQQYSDVTLIGRSLLRNSDAPTLTSAISG